MYGHFQLCSFRITLLQPACRVPCPCRAPALRPQADGGLSPSSAAQSRVGFAAPQEFAIGLSSREASVVS